MECGQQCHRMQFRLGRPASKAGVVHGRNSFLLSEALDSINCRSCCNVVQQHCMPQVGSHDSCYFIPQCTVRPAGTVGTRVEAVAQPLSTLPLGFAICCSVWRPQVQAGSSAFVV
jgi:hypothetical protein